MLIGFFLKEKAKAQAVYWGTITLVSLYVPIYLKTCTTGSTFNLFPQQ